MSTRIGKRVRDLADAMRAVGAGRATLDGLTLDLTIPPLRVHTPIAVVARTEAEEIAEAEADRDRVRFAAGAGRRIRLPMGGGL